MLLPIPKYDGSIDGYNTVTPLYYEQALKLKYTRGDDIDSQSKIIDMIVEGARTDFTYINNVGNIAGIFYNCVKAGQNSFASRYAERGGLAEYKLKQMIDKYEDRVYG